MKSVEDDTKFMCSYCSKEFKYKSEKIRHEISHYKLFECEICSKKFNFQSALHRHKKQHERTGTARCEKCNRKFRDEILLKRHIQYAHKGTFSCSNCNSMFHSELALSTHMKTHKPKSERRFNCTYCDKSFNFSHHLKHHEMTHTKVKQHYCNVCGKGFIQTHHLKSHLKMHNTSDRYMCEYPDCKKRFTSKYTMKRHMMKHDITKHDNGISSDSNTADNKEVSRDSLIDCSKKIPPNNNYEEHSICIDTDTKINVKDLVIEIEALTQDDKVENITDPEPNLDIGNCKTVLGSCITNDNNCICEQISQNNSNLELKNEVDTEMKDSKINVNNKKSQNNACEGCDCANICNEKAKMNCHLNRNEDNNNMPLITNVNGIVKLNDTYDFDMKSEQNSTEFMPFTCKDIIGKCIVGGNESCLCAKMFDEQSHAQEIDDITPHPKTENY